MQITIRPISASLIRDTETFTRMVQFYSFRIPIVLLLLEIKDKRQEHTLRVENNHNGMIHLISL